MEREGLRMSRTAKIFVTGGSQAVRLPADYRFDGPEVYIRKEGDRVVLSSQPFRPESWAEYLLQGARVTDDFMGEIQDLPVQQRESM
jgi:antitoxin VapB